MARYLKYAVLFLTLGMAWYYGSLSMSAYDPYSAYSHIWSIACSIEKAATLSSLTLEKVYKQLGIPESVPKTTQFKNISEKYPVY